MEQFKKSQRGFTLIELMVVVLIIGLISTLVTVNVSRARRSAMDARKIADLGTISAATATFYVDQHAYPRALNDLRGIGSIPAYLTNIPTDVNPSTGGQVNYGWVSYPSTCTSANHNCTCYIVSTTLYDASHNPLQNNSTYFAVKNGENSSSTTCP